MAEKETKSNEHNSPVNIKTCSLEQARVIFGYRTIEETKAILDDRDINPYNLDNPDSSDDPEPMYLRSDVLSTKYLGQLDELKKKLALVESENEGLVKLVIRQISSGDLIDELELDETPEEIYAQGNIDHELWEKYDSLREHFYGLRQNMINLVLERMDLRKDNERLKDRLQQ